MPPIYTWKPGATLAVLWFFNIDQDFWKKLSSYIFLTEFCGCCFISVPFSWAANTNIVFSVMVNRAHTD